jgi:hypothetical protein
MGSGQRFVSDRHSPARHSTTLAPHDQAEIADCAGGSF